MEKLHSALEIVAMGLPGLPSTKARLIDRATKEGWYYEEQKAQGGTRRMYRIPERYTDGTSLAAPQVAKVVGTIAAGSSKVDQELLQLAMRAFEEFAAAHSLVIAPERKAALIALLYDYLARGAGEQEVASFLQAMG